MTATAPAEKNERARLSTPSPLSTAPARPLDLPLITALCASHGVIALAPDRRATLAARDLCAA
jgi:hypothetical protein